MACMGNWTGNKQEIADWFKVSLPTLNDWVRKGCPVLEMGKKGVGWVFDIRAVTRWHEQTIKKPDLTDLTISPISDVTYRRAIAEAELKEIELAEKRHEVTDINRVIRDMGNVFVQLRTKLLSIPIKASPLLAACRTEAQFQAILTKQIDEALHALSDLPFLADDALPASGKAPDSPTTPHRERVGRSVPHAQSRKQRGARTVGHGPR